MKSASKAKPKRRPPKTPLTVPVLKMPPDLTLPALRVLLDHRTPEGRRTALVALRPDIPPRTLLNAYVLPSLVELRLFKGTLRSGQVTRYAEAIATADDENARQLMARHLLELDAARVGLVGWLAEASHKAERRKTMLRRFIEQRLGLTGDEAISTLDRLGKWGGYLIFFGVIRENPTDRGVIWTANRRHVEALRTPGTNLSAASLSNQARREALLEAYSKATRRIGTQLYLPINVLRDDLGRIFQHCGTLLSDTQLDEIIRQAPTLLTEHFVSFSPFSGPARDGLQLGNMYAGFVSVRFKPTTDKQSTSKH